MPQTTICRKNAREEAPLDDTWRSVRLDTERVPRKGEGRGSCIPAGCGEVDHGAGKACFSLVDLVDELFTYIQFSNKIIPQAAISNLYSPGDTLSPHRDVSESSAAALVSLSIGCDALFVIGLDDSSEVLVMRIRSGDAVIMDRESRWAWHSVPKILAETCPGWLADWPADGWMGRKRVNLNVRQMWD